MTPRFTPRPKPRGRIVWVLIVVIVALGAMQLFLPTLVERRIEAFIHESFADVKLARVEVEAFPAVLLLGGRLSSITIDARRVDLGHLTLDAAMLDGRHINVDMRRLLSGEGIAIQSAQSLRATLVLTEDDLNRYFRESLNQSQFFHVNLQRGTATLTGRFRLLGREMEVVVSGQFRVDEGTSVIFVPRDVSLANSRLPQAVLDSMIEEWHIPLNLDQAPIPLVITDLLVEDGKLLIYGDYPQ